MIKILRVVLGLAALVVVVAFAVANRMPVAVSLAPLPIVLELPVYGVFLLGLVLGGLLGGIALWLGGARYRLTKSVEGAEPVKLDAPFPVQIAPAAWV